MWPAVADDSWHMTTTADDLLTRISDEFADMSRQMHTLSDDFAALRTALKQQPGTTPHPASRPEHAQPASTTPPTHPQPPASEHHRTVPVSAAPPVAFGYPHGVPDGSATPPRPWGRGHGVPPVPGMPPNPTRLPGGYVPSQLPPPSWRPAPPRPPRPPLTDRIAAAFGKGTIATALAAAGVGVTLIGVVLLLVLAAQAGILHPGIRVAAGAVFAAGLVGTSLWWQRRPSGRTGAVALAATGVAAGYLDVVAAARIYEWLSVPAALGVAAVIAGGGLILSRRWSSQALGLLVVTPIVVLAPVLTEGVDIVLVSFMIVLAAATGWVQLGRDWTWLFLVRMAAPTVPMVLLAGLASVGVGPDESMWSYAVAAGVTLLVGVGSALVALPSSSQPALLAGVTALTALPVLMSGALLDDLSAASLIATSAAALVLVVVAGSRSTGVTTGVREIWAATVALLALVAATTAFNGGVDVVVILGFGLIAAVSARRTTAMARATRVIATVLVVIGGMGTLSLAPPAELAHATALAPGAAATILVQCVLLVGAVWALADMWIASARAHGRRDRSNEQLWWVALGVVSLYAFTQFAVTAGVLAAGTEEGFFAGHLIATVAWMIAAAAALAYASRLPSTVRTPLLAGGLAVVGAAIAKLFLFDLATLDGVFRVLAFIVTGLLLLAMGAWFARSLTEGDDHPADNHVPADGPAQRTGPV